MGWPSVAQELIALLKKFGGAIAAWVSGFFAGRASRGREIEKAERKALEKELTHEREEDAILSDPIAVERMRERFKKPE